jgi:hypothetical protein
MKRYTSKQLEIDVAKLNAKLENFNHKYRFVVGYRYNYVAIDIATPE